MHFRHLFLGAAAVPSPLAVFSAEAKRTFREWYYPYGIIMPKETTPETGVHGVNSDHIEHLVLANLTQQEATAKITYYFEEDPPIHRTHIGFTPMPPMSRKGRIRLPICNGSRARARSNRKRRFFKMGEANG